MARKNIKYRTGNNGMSYLRVSSKGQVETEYDSEGMSLPAQRRKLSERARAKELVIVDELIDAGITATNIEDRKSYQGLIERLKADESLAFVMVYSVNRLHRNWTEAGLMLMQLRSMGVRLISAMEDIDDSTAAGRLQLGVLFSTAGYQSESSSEDLEYKMTQKAIIGGTPGFVPIGYLNVSEQFEGRKVNTVAVDPERGQYIPMAFEWFATGHYTYAELRTKLTEAGLRTRPNRKYPSGAISIHSIEKVLRNRYYLGYVVWNGQEYQGRHEPLVSQELFDQVQSVLEAMPGAGNRQRRYHHFLKGFVWCARCERRLIVMRARNKTGELYFYYLCRGRQQKLCDLPYLRTSHVENAVTERYHTVALDGELKQQLSALFAGAAGQWRSSRGSNRKQMKKRLTEIDRQEDRYIELALDPDWPKEKLTNKLRQLRDERKRLTEELAAGEHAVTEAQANASSVLDYLEEPYELYQRSGIRTKTAMNRTIFTGLRIDADEVTKQPYVASDILTEAFEAIVELRRNWQAHSAAEADAQAPETTHYERKNNGSAPVRDAADDVRVLSLLEQAFYSPQCSSNSTLAEDRGFEPLRAINPTRVPEG
ncbi:recombinase family protein [Mycobacteroides abscessus]|uniref:recombinase family protein n=1 Tax=Mycobacteroides abscessus TaxID=36809 RepID=UPI00210571EB|nr:recombinase family protein [Mycobacteroides abscessus]